MITTRSFKFHGNIADFYDYYVMKINNIILLELSYLKKININFNEISQNLIYYSFFEEINSAEFFIINFILYLFF